MSLILHKAYSDTNGTLYLTDAEAAAVQSGYFLPVADGKDPLSVSEAWNTQTGLFFFLGKAAQRGGFAQLSEKLAFYANNLTHAACLWAYDYTTLVPVSSTPPERFSYCAYPICFCALQSTAPPATQVPVVLTALVDGEKVTIERNVDFSLDGYGLLLPAGSGLSFSADQDALQITYPPVEGVGPAAPNLTLSLAGDSAGVFRGETSLGDLSMEKETGWEAGLRYSAMGFDATSSQFYPMFTTDKGQQFLMQMQWNPSDGFATDERASWLRFTGVSFRLEQQEAAWGIAAFEKNGLLRSAWRTIYGQEILLRPLTDGPRPARLVFQRRPGDGTPTGSYLAPDGEFELCVPGHGGQRLRLLCGLSGAECIEFTAGDDTHQGDLLCFYADGAANTHSFPLDSGLSGGAELDQTATAPWVMVRGSGSQQPVYYASPKAAPLYQPGSDQTLPAADVPVAYFTDKVTGDGRYAFPMVPYAGVDRSWPMDLPEGEIASFEEEIIARNRNRIIGSIPPELQKMSAALTADPQMAVTPQGLLATTEGLDWTSVVLAVDAGGNALSFLPQAEKGIPAKLRTAFQSNDLFLVASDNTHLGDFRNHIMIEDWQFNLNVPKQHPDQDPVYQNLLILKFRKGRLRDLLANTDYWTDPTAFNLEAHLNGVQNWLLQYCNDARTMGEKDDSFSAFNALLDDENWLGVLSLNTDIDLGQFPNDLKGLIGGMDLSRFRAHHAGAQASFVRREGKLLSSDKSGMFALINYTDADQAEATAGMPFAALRGRRLLQQQVPQPEEQTYAYKVLKLKVLFAASAVTNFVSQLQFSARKWFGDPVSLNPPAQPDAAPNYSMLLNGHYENHDGHPTYTFLTDRGIEYVYYASSRVVGSVDIIKAQFSTRQQQGGDGVTEHVSGVFSLTGYLDLLRNAQADLFSFGSATGQTPHKGLYFSQLAVEVDFDLDTLTHASSNLVLAFNPLPAAFDPAQGTIRPESLAASVPISPTGFLSHRSGDVKGMGYNPIRLPLELQSEGIDSAEWYGLKTDFHWGGPGALADEVGFVPNILLAWSPGGDSVKMEASIRLPGSGGSQKTLSLQGVLALKVKNFNLVKVTDKQISYNLMLNGITLSVLGLGFPPVGNTSLALLGNPDDSATMGWYGMYKK